MQQITCSLNWYSLGEKFDILVLFFQDHDWLSHLILVSFKVSVLEKNKSARESPNLINLSPFCMQVPMTFHGVGMDFFWNYTISSQQYFYNIPTKNATQVLGPLHCLEYRAIASWYFILGYPYTELFKHWRYISLGRSGGMFPQI